MKVKQLARFTRREVADHRERGEDIVNMYMSRLVQEGTEPPSLEK